MSKFEHKVATLGIGIMLIWITIFILGLAGLAGWGKNIYKLAHLDFEPPYKAEIVRFIGVLPPAGAVIGYLDIEDKPIPKPMKPTKQTPATPAKN